MTTTTLLLLVALNVRSRPADHPQPMDGKEYLLDQSLTALSEKLPHRFLQVHRSAIVNLDHIREVRKYFNNRFILYLDTHPVVKLTTGPTYAEAVQEALKI